ncbi:hypothetical protein MCOR25_005018 [Pyricularia grisea]|uniref:Uncharacterized protein n=1 Tax=Pyricularia grisea TaxID=148305 RepID=A0A6P8B735_PYRGI|nr:hypothetical protein PgNI_05544 [Pyricularia grisea]KAI6366967.1 hypothetical protein MCOR25_005018 [Pyricularia grisea]TLD10939.1 hypothetical protein PgNI_05544 [Pyricularia grisea]
MSTNHLQPSNPRVNNSNSPSPLSSGTSTPVNGQSSQATRPPAAPATERIANFGSYGGRNQPSNWPSLLATDPMAREIERMSRP